MDFYFVHGGIFPKSVSVTSHLLERWEHLLFHRKFRPVCYHFFCRCQVGCSESKNKCLRSISMRNCNWSYKICKNYEGFQKLCMIKKDTNFGYQKRCFLQLQLCKRQLFRQKFNCWLQIFTLQDFFLRLKPKQYKKCQ